MRKVVFLLDNRRFIGSKWRSLVGVLILKTYSGTVQDDFEKTHTTKHFAALYKFLCGDPSKTSVGSYEKHALYPGW